MRQALKGASKTHLEIQKPESDEPNSPLEIHSGREYKGCTCGAVSSPLFENLVWLSSKEAAIYLRKFTKSGAPSDGTIRAMVRRGQIRARKFQRRLYFSRRELDRLIETSDLTGGY